MMKTTGKRLITLFFLISCITCTILSLCISQNSFCQTGNPSAKIKFDITQCVRREMQDVRLVGYNVLGREVSTLVDEKLSPGSYEIDF